MEDEAKIPIEPPPVVIVPPKPKIRLHEPDESFDVTFCCARGNRTSCDKALLEWFAKTLVSGSVLTFCFWQLANNNGSSEYYTSSISLIIGTYLGTHQASQKKSKQP
jgi:hypothetical protein